ncbi:hypothetical protein BB561_005150 [Smittium simulii]|uniref:Uncharacterized protein n=1 Tax=Smittium simulii TaxID=133385 RepID=A0A2T9YBW1_9FUNG|nr:hypothetical protein BB561_005150 [Smittium simulii]
MESPIEPPITSVSPVGISVSSVPSPVGISVSSVPSPVTQLPQTLSKPLPKTEPLPSFTFNSSIIISPHPVKPFVSSFLDLKRASTAVSSSIRKPLPYKKPLQPSATQNSSRFSSENDLARQELMGIFSLNQPELEPSSLRSKTSITSSNSKPRFKSSSNISSFTRPTALPSPLYRAANPLPLDDSFKINC